MDTARSFAQFRTDVFRLHAEGQYGRALELVERDAAAFPAEASGIMYWRICLLARGGDSAGALNVMEQALGTGWWRGERILRRDPDLAHLQGTAEFERLVDICRVRERVAQTQARSTMAILVPESAPPPAGYPVLIALHGFGGNIADFRSSWKDVSKMEWLVALPQASQVVDWEGYAWDDRDLAGREMREHYAALCGKHRIDPSRIVLAGFSQGGTMATWLALQGIPAAARGVFGIVPGARDPQTFARLATAHTGDLRVYIVVGGRDFAVDGVRHFAHVLESAGLRTKVQEQVDLDHEIPPNFDEIVADALDFIIGDRAAKA